MSNAGSSNIETDVSGSGHDLAYSVAGNTRVYSCVPGSDCNACVNFVSASSGNAQLTNDTFTSIPCSGGSPQAWSFEAWVYGVEGATAGVVAARATTVGIDANTSTWSSAWNFLGGFNFIQYQTGTGLSTYWSINSSTTCSANTWCMINATVSASPQAIFYLNASNAGSTSTSTGSCGGSGKTQNFTVGSIDATSPTFVDGTIDEISLYNTTLSGGTITTHYNAGISPGACSSSGDWPCTVLNTFPPFMNGGYMKKVVDRGYNTGLFTVREKLPPEFNLAWLNFTKLPKGNF